MKKTWTKEEIEYLKDKWGNTSLETLSDKLNRTEAAVKQKAQKLGLAAFLKCGEYITFNEMCLAITGHNANSYQMTSWVKNRNFPLKYKKVGKSKFRIVYLEEFWKWAEKNQDFLDFSKFKTFSLGVEPDWVVIKRKMDKERAAQSQKNNIPWTIDDDNKLKHYLSMHKYTLQEVTKKLNRTTGAVLRRINTLGIMDRPVPENNHNKYTDNEKRQLLYLVMADATYHKMAETLGKSERAIRGYMYRQYGTERLSKIKKHLTEVKTCA